MDKRWMYSSWHSPGYEGSVQGTAEDLRYRSVWGNKVLAETVQQANTVANFIQDSSSAKTLQHRDQVTSYGRRRAIEVHVPTHFATHFHVMKNINNSSAALKQVASDQAWHSLDGKSAQVCPLQDIIAVVVVIIQYNTTFQLRQNVQQIDDA
jgi:hypothetical protein